ncbi:UNVERIFIED_CONTAM: hypothetical protein K2H54_047234 [Gekko kuhli]
MRLKLTSVLRYKVGRYSSGKHPNLWQNFMSPTRATVGSWSHARQHSMTATLITSSQEGQLLLQFSLGCSLEKNKRLVLRGIIGLGLWPAHKIFHCPWGQKIPPRDSQSMVTANLWFSRQEAFRGGLPSPASAWQPWTSLVSHPSTKQGGLCSA